ncbi:hypothetical protein [Acidisphaera sp. L21]|uniref:hypothetical protein n=1 Tax=Acidisphaera sp. L21 TaxID=1641851 RepID=UPI00131DDB38|nr:hypothetical protein [Acidisphaera sp. L21]
MAAASPAYSLTPRERTRLAGILARLASPFESERAAAGLLASAYMAKHNLTWSDLMTGHPASPPPPPAPEKPSRERRHSLGALWRGYNRRRAAQAQHVLSRLA